MLPEILCLHMAMMATSVNSNHKKDEGAEEVHTQHILVVVSVIGIASALLPI